MPQLTWQKKVGRKNTSLWFPTLPLYQIRWSLLLDVNLIKLTCIMKIRISGRMSYFVSAIYWPVLLLRRKITLSWPLKLFRMRCLYPQSVDCLRQILIITFSQFTTSQKWKSRFPACRCHKLKRVKGLFYPFPNILKIIFLSEI